MDLYLTMAVLPGAVLLFYIYKKDPVEKEPASLLVKLLLLGAVSVLPAMAIEIALNALLIGNVAQPTLWQLVLENFIIVALVEEVCKFAFLHLSAWNHQAFDFVFDGIVYAVFVSLGFAIAENIMYTFSYGLGTAVLRAFTAIPGHCVFGVFMGVFYGRAKLAEARGLKSAHVANLFLALLVPTFCHGMYDFLATISGTVLTTILFYAFLIGMVVVAMLLVKKAAQQAMRITAQAQQQQQVVFSDTPPFSGGGF